MDSAEWETTDIAFLRWPLACAKKDHLETGFPVAGVPMAMSNGQDLDCGGQELDGFSGHG